MVSPTRSTNNLRAGQVVLADAIAGESPALGIAALSFSNLRVPLQADGRFEFIALSAGRFALNVGLPALGANDLPLALQVLGVELPNSASGPDALDLGTLEIAAGGRVSVTVAGAQGPLALAAFVLAPDGDKGQLEPYSASPEPGGGFAFLLPAGQHVIAAGSAGGSAQSLLNVTAGQTQPLALTLSGVSPSDRRDHRQAGSGRCAATPGLYLLSLATGYAPVGGSDFLFDAGFGQVGSISEGFLAQLADGRLVVADQDNANLRLVDLDAGRFLGAPLALGDTPFALAVSSTDQIYVGTRTAVSLIDFDAGIVQIVAGSDGGRGFVDGPGPLARFATINALAMDPQGYVSLSDDDGVRRIDPEGGVVTLATDLLAVPSSVAGAAGTPLLAGDSLAQTVSAVTGCETHTPVLFQPGLAGDSLYPLLLLSDSRSGQLLLLSSSASGGLQIFSQPAP